MEKLFNENNINFVDENVDWKTALKLSVDLLVKNESATDELYNAIIESTKKYGPYYILIPKIALAHAEPSSYCLKPDITFTFFKNEIKFADDDSHNVKIIAALSCPDNKTHMSYLQKFAMTFSNNDLRNKLLDVDTKESLIEILKGENLW